MYSCFTINRSFKKEALSKKHHTLEAILKLFGISGSPRIAATDGIIKEALRYAEAKWNAETRYFSVRGKKLNFCLHCDHCIKKGSCVHDDAMKDAYSGFEWADAILIGLNRLMEGCSLIEGSDKNV